MNISAIAFCSLIISGRNNQLQVKRYVNIWRGCDWPYNDKRVILKIQEREIRIRKLNADHSTVLGFESIGEGSGRNIIGFTRTYRKKQVRQNEYMYVPSWSL